jgi:hypothetical protein
MILTLALLALTGCNGSTPSAEGIRLAPPDAALMASCASPRPIPPEAGAATQEALWRADRINLANCRDRHGALAEWAQGVAEIVAP